MQQIKAVLFDLDGTLIDTDNQTTAKVASWLEPVLGQSQAPKIARQLIMAGESPSNALITWLDRLHLDSLFMRVKELRKRPLHKTTYQLVPHVEPMLERVAQQYRVGIVTTRSEATIHNLFTQYPLIGNMAEVIVGSDSVRRLKPHPQPIWYAAEQLKLPVETCLMVGDTTVDIYSAKRAGTKAIGVLCGFGQKAELQRAGADTILQSTADVADYLNL